MARRHLSNPREGEDRGHGRDRRELRALRQRVRDLEAQVAHYQQPANERFEAAMESVRSSIAEQEQQAAGMVSQRQALAECQGILRSQQLRIGGESSDRGSFPRTLHTRLAETLARLALWLRQLVQGGR